MRPIARYGFLGNVRKLLSQAAFFIDAKESGMGQTATNLGTAGSVLDAQYGSTTGADTNDPLLLEHDGTNYLYLPGSVNYASAPDIAAYDITGDIEIVVRVALDDWTPSAAGTLMSKRTDTEGLSWQLTISATGTADFSFRSGGTNYFTNGTLTAPAPLTDGATYWFKFTRTAATGAIAGGHAVDQATEPSSFTAWTASGTRTSGNIEANNAPLQVGANRLGDNPLIGKFYRAIVRNGIGGTVVFDADFTTGITSGGQTTFTESSSNAATVTINRSTSGRKSVAVVRDVWLFGTDDYMEVADNDLLDFGASDSFTVVAVVRRWGAARAQQFVGKAGASQQGWRLWEFSGDGRPYMTINDGSINSQDSGPVLVAGAATMIAGVRDTPANTIETYAPSSDGSTIATITALANALAVRIGATPGGADVLDGELLAAAIFRRALSADEITSIANYYGAS